MTSMLVGWFSYLTSDVVRPRTTDKQGFEGVQPPLFHLFNPMDYHLAAQSHNDHIIRSSLLIH